MNNKGFTLIEVLSVIVIIALIAAIAVPVSFSVSNKVRNKLLDNKMELAKKAAVLWGQDNIICLTDEGSCDSVMCTIDVNDTYINHCKITLNTLAENDYISYDDNKKIINPVNKKDISSSTITLDYNMNTKNVSATDYKVIEN
jgi:prepilin-type N-terminal cleavage/methylation domain-containing protein